jgi:hypothetical protein
VVWILGVLAYYNTLARASLLTRHFIASLVAKLADAACVHDALWLMGNLSADDVGVGLLVDAGVVPLLRPLLREHTDEVIFLIGSITTCQTARDQGSA